MYRKLLQYINRFVEIETIVQGKYCDYQGKLENLDAETFTIQTYDDDGEKEGLWIGRLSDIVSVMVGHDDLKRLALEVKYQETAEGAEVAP